MTEAKLLVCIISHEKRVEDVLEALLDAGIARASIVDVRGMLEYLADEIPLFAGFRTLLEDSGKNNKMIVSVVENAQKITEAFNIIEDIYGDFAKTNTGIMFSLDISDIRGLKL